MGLGLWLRVLMVMSYRGPRVIRVINYGLYGY
jgi:hypothetical protein